jgi:DNA-binding Xre family transcriptional regulator
MELFYLFSFIYIETIAIFVGTFLIITYMLRVKEIAKEKGIAIAIVANRMGIKAPALSRIINGGNTTTDTLQKIANALDVPVADLFEQSAKDIVNCPYCGGKIKIGKE